MGNPSGFWSYVHADDDAESGRISDLARDVVARYKLITGDEIDLFLDRDSLAWGDAWRAKVDSSLASVAFFIPVITPRFFQSAECRRELNFFARKASSLGVRELVMPILYADVAALHVEPVDDEAMRTVKSFQWEDWTDLGLEERESSAYRRGVAKLASRLASANEAAERVDVAAVVAASEEDEDEDEDDPGTIDKMAGAEAAMPEWTRVINDISDEIRRVGEIVEDAGEAIQIGNNQGKSFAARLTVAKRLSQQLAEPGDRIVSLSQEFTESLNAVDAGVQTIIEQAPNEAGDSESARQSICEFFASIRGLSAASEQGLGSVASMVEVIEPIESMSRDLRPVLRTMRKGLTVLTEGRHVMRDWERLIDATGIEC